MFTLLEPMPVPMTIVDSVRESYARCRQNPDFFDAFYDHFARKSSEIGPLFSNTNMQKQNELLSDAIDSLISFSEENGNARRHLDEIGKSHSRKYLNIKPEWYPLWMEALRDTIRESDSEHSSRLLDDWNTVLQPGIEHIVRWY